MQSVTTLGFVGLGAFASELATACARCPAIRIGACYDPQAERAAAFAQRHGCRRLASVDAMGSDPELRGVVVTSPNHHHCEQAARLMEAGLHVFVEKPLGVDLDQIDQLLATARATGRLLAVGHQQRRVAPFRRIKRMLDDGSIGRVYSFEANHCGDLLRAWPDDDWRFSKHGVGPLLHKGIHKIDVLNYLFGAAETVTTTATVLATNPSMHETAVSTLRYPGGVIGTLTAGFRYNNATFNLYGEHRSVRYGGHGRTIEVKHERTWHTEQVDCGHDDPLAEELAEFAAAIGGHGTIEVDGAAAREAMVVAIGAELAAHRGGSLALDSLRNDAPLTSHTAGSVA